MPIPDSQSLLLPALQALAGGAETPISEIRRRIAEAKGLTPQDVRELLPNSGHPVFANRVSWMMLHLEHAGLVEKVRRGVWRVTAEGKGLLAKAPDRIDRETLRSYPAYIAWRTGESAGSNDAASVLSEDSAGTPEEALHLAVEQLRSALEADVLGRVRKVTPAFFERIIVDLLLAMGYGGGNPTMGRVTGRSGDGGIDGTIKEDALGLDEIYVQEEVCQWQDCRRKRPAKFCWGTRRGGHDQRRLRYHGRFYACCRRIRSPESETHCPDRR